MNVKLMYAGSTGSGWEPKENFIDHMTKRYKLLRMLWYLQTIGNKNNPNVTKNYKEHRVPKNLKIGFKIALKLHK